ncbi:MAG: hypothetical protein FWE35_06345 [Streptosporangiales bacterium]|nr:hypothetical protein [Streptosporangiales bacterium]
MRTSPEAPEWLAAYTAAERPDLWEKAVQDNVFEGVWPKYNLFGNQAARYFGELYPRFADTQILFIDERTGNPVARGQTIPFRWDGTLEDLPAGIDAVGLRGVEAAGEPSALSALAAEVLGEYKMEGLSRQIVAAMGEAARNRGLSAFVAPVRPFWKDWYPLTPIEKYARWKQDGGLPFDPWMRVHVRMGAEIVRPEPRSMEITAPVKDWQSWTGMVFPEDGDYVFPKGLAPLTITGGTGSYWEPNVWMRHPL